MNIESPIWWLALVMFAQMLVAMYAGWRFRGNRRRRLVVKCEHPDCPDYQLVDELSDFRGQAYHPQSESWPPPELRAPPYVRQRLR